MAEVNSEIDALDANELNDVYNKMLRLFNYVCNNVFLLKIVALPARVPLYDARMESVQDIENFYGEKPQEEMPKVNQLKLKLSKDRTLLQELYLLNQEK